MLLTKLQHLHGPNCSPLTNTNTFVATSVFSFPVLLSDRLTKEPALPINAPRTSTLLENKAAASAEPNFMGGISYKPSPLTQLRMMAGSCFFGEPRYYQEAELNMDCIGTAPEWVAARLDSVMSGPQGGDSAQLLPAAIDRALDFDPEATLQEAARLRNEDNFRVTPQVILVRAALHHKIRGTQLVRTYARLILRRADEPATGLAYYLSLSQSDSPFKRIPNSLKRAWREYLEGLGDYALAKYRQTDRQVSLVDVVNLVHAYSPSINKLVRGQLKLTGQTWEAVVSAGKGSPEAWQETLPFITHPKGHMALLRNLRNLHGVKLLTPDILDALKAGVENGEQLPFRYYSAHLALSAQGMPSFVSDGLSACLDLSTKNLPRFKGRVMSLSDNSGSARGATTSEYGTMAVATIGNLMAVITGMQADEGYVGLFGDGLSVIPVRHRDSALTQLAQVEEAGNHVGESTENGIWLFFDKALREREHWDHIFIYSDMQAGHGGLFGIDPAQYPEFSIDEWGHNRKGERYIDVAALVARYRKRVNPNVMVYMVQTAGYRNSLMPEFYDRTFILGGWSDSVLRFAGRMTEMHPA